MPNSRKKFCPKCGDLIVLKHGRDGKFYGCVNYPNCKYTEVTNG